MISKTRRCWRSSTWPGPSRTAARRFSSRGERDGKELLARAIHDESPRSDAPFISVSCASLTESLLETELFGTRRGRSRGERHPPRKLELAQDGTLFLDEIGDISLKLQMDLLRSWSRRSSGASAARK